MFGRFAGFVIRACLRRISRGVILGDCGIRLKRSDHYFGAETDQMISFQNLCFAGTPTYQSHHSLQTDLTFMKLLHTIENHVQTKLLLKFQYTGQKLSHPFQVR